MYSEAAWGHGRVLWRSTGNGDAVIPADGCVDLIVREEEVYLAGPSTMPIATLADGEGGSLGLRFSPGTATPLLALGLGLGEYCDQLVSLREVGSRAQVGRVRDVLLRAGSRGGAVEVGAGLGSPEPSELSVARTVRRHATRGTPPDRVAELLGWSPRTLRRHVLARFGYPYPTLVRLERSRRAQTLLREGATISDAAAQAGYADQPHLSREFRRLVGMSPGQFVASDA